MTDLEIALLAIVVVALLGAVLVTLLQGGNKGESKDRMNKR